LALAPLEVVDAEGVAAVVVPEVAVVALEVAALVVTDPLVEVLLEVGVDVAGREEEEDPDVAREEGEETEAEDEVTRELEPEVVDAVLDPVIWN